MGRGDRRHSIKSMQKDGQRKKKARLKKKASERAARFAATGKSTEKKPRAARKPAA